MSNEQIQFSRASDFDSGLFSFGKKYIVLVLLLNFKTDAKVAFIVYTPSCDFM